MADPNQKSPRSAQTACRLRDATALLLALMPMFGVVLALLSLPSLLGEELGGAILSRALMQAFRGGIPGFAAAIVQILSLMWLRTTINYQYKTGSSLPDTLRTLWKAGGVRRFYRGFAPAIVLVPLSRFGDTAANEGVLALLEGSGWISTVMFKTAMASVISMIWRVLLMPLVVTKTTLQVGGITALMDMRAKVQRLGVFGFYFQGAVATMVAQFLGHYPWFMTSNALEQWIPVITEYATGPEWVLLRAALIGCIASIVSDTITNSIRVVNTYRQTSQYDLTYAESIQRLVSEDGILGLFTRGLGAKMLVNCLNSIVFKVLLKLIVL